ncbi:hypothetical protein, partial [Pseudomonas sp. BJa3]|uniref:hypothetical protein n=1 Tax=Pseudomonas sp. BJa3 TaxID=2986525 RepID=UPI002265E320
IVGSASWELRATRDKLKQDLRDSETDVKQAVGAMERDATAGADKVGASFGKMGKAIGVGIPDLRTASRLSAGVSGRIPG